MELRGPLGQPPASCGEKGSLTRLMLGPAPGEREEQQQTALVAPLMELLGKWLPMAATSS
jgi:hypothetical protein